MSRLALLSVSDKTALDVLGRALERLGWSILSTGGTAAALREAGVVLVPGSAFGSEGRGTIRLSFGNQPVARITEAGERLLEMR